MTDLDAIRTRAANIATGSIYSQAQTAADYSALLAEIDRRTTDLIAEQSVRQDEWDHASELLKDGVKSVSYWEQQVVRARAERDRYLLAWMSARSRATYYQGLNAVHVEALTDSRRRAADLADAVLDGTPRKELIELITGRAQGARLAVVRDAGREPAVLAIPDDELGPLLALADDETEQS